ncbi:MAG: VTT domain-containing protein [Hyphomonas sp.]
MAGWLAGLRRKCEKMACRPRSHEGQSLSVPLLFSLFFGAFFDATLGTCFFVFGEAFFLLAGGLAYSDQAWGAVAAVFAGAYAADQTGYVIGRRLRPWFLRFALATRRRRASYRKALSLLDRHGVKAVAVSRLLGPVAWFMPAICGSVGLPWQRFALGSAIGVLLGVGGFVCLGYAGAWGAEHGDVDVRALIADHKWAILLVGQGVFLAAALISRFVGSALFRKL